MDAFFERLIVRAATIDELLSDAFEPLPGQKGDTDLAARRLAAWCRSCASGDWLLFNRRLQRDGLAIDQVLSRLTSVQIKPSSTPPGWVSDAIWIDKALQRPTKYVKPDVGFDQNEPCAFEQLLTPVVEEAEVLLWTEISSRAFNNLNESARACLRRSLLEDLSDLSAPAIYERFARARNTNANPMISETELQHKSTSCYVRFVTEMRAGGLRSLFDAKPVLLRLIASLTRQWIDTSREFIQHLDADLAAVRREIIRSDADARVAKVEGALSDPHNGGHSVLIVSFEDDSRVVYKPKDLRIDAAWHTLTEQLVHSKPPFKLTTPRVLPRDGYGWTEFIEHTGCANEEDCGKFFQRAGGWLALFHVFAASDMHQENMIAAGDNPVPIDLETVLQATPEEHRIEDPEGQAFDAATEIIANSVMMVGLLPAYGRSPDNNVFAMGGMTSDWRSKIKIKWNNINSDDMRPEKSKETDKTNPNLPHVDGQYARFGAHINDFISGFENYAKFLLKLSRGENQGRLLDGFAGIPVRKVIRPTRFYYMLLQRLKNHRVMDDGAIWSAQADFIARLAEWQNDSDPVWPLQKAERSALLELNVPHFITLSDGNEIRDASGVSVQINPDSGLNRARARIRSFIEEEISWQIDVIRENTRSVAKVPEPAVVRDRLSRPERTGIAFAPNKEIFIAESKRIAGELSRRAIRKGPGAAWIGLDWLGDAEVYQLACLGPDLYNGVSGIAVFLAAHAAVTGDTSSGDLARAGVSYLRKRLKSRNAARMARTLGIGGATGLGSIVYAMSVLSKCLQDDGLLADAHAVAGLLTDDVIAADKRLDVIGGSAGAILGLLRLYRDSQSVDVLKRATKCGDHLISQSRLGSEGRRGWVGQGFGTRPLNGMSHGASGFAYALASLAAATGRDEFAQYAKECIAFENASYDAGRNNWPDLRGSQGPTWPCQWCHGATGIGLARIGMLARSRLDSEFLKTDVNNALAGVERCWPGHFDTLCCGTLGSIEFFCDAGNMLGKKDLCDLASRRLATILEAGRSGDDYRWNSGNSRFNLGLFRGLAGVGYTSLRQVERSLPNVLVWE